MINIGPNKDVKDDLAEVKNKSLKNKSATDYLLWLFKERDVSLHGFKKFLDGQRISEINQVNK